MEKIGFWMNGSNGDNDLKLETHFCCKKVSGPEKFRVSWVCPFKLTSFLKVKNLGKDCLYLICLIVCTCRTRWPASRGQWPGQWPPSPAWSSTGRRSSTPRVSTVDDACCSPVGCLLFAYCVIVVLFVCCVIVVCLLFPCLSVLCLLFTCIMTVVCLLFALLPECCLLDVCLLFALLFVCCLLVVCFVVCLWLLFTCYLPADYLLIAYCLSLLVVCQSYTVVGCQA